MKASEALEKAAEHMQEVGLYQGGYYFDPHHGVEAEAPCCALGAVASVFWPEGEDTFDWEQYDATVVALGGWVKANTDTRRVTEWSDHALGKRTVVTGLREAAQLAREAGQ